MAAKAVLTLTPMPPPAASAASSSGCAGAPAPASSPAKSSSGTADGGLAGANASASQTAQPAADGSATSSRSAAATSDSPSAKPSGRSGPAESGNPATDSESGRPEATPARQGRGASAVSSAPAAQDAAPTAAATANFSAALAQSLAATAAGQAGQAESAATPAIPSSNATGRCEAGDSSEPPAKHSTADPVSTALTLLQNALAGALLGVPAALPATAAATGASGASSQDGHIGAGSSTAAALNTLLAQNSATDLKSAVSTSPSTTGASTTGPATAAPPAPATNAPVTALTSLPLMAGSAAVAAQHTKPDPTAMALSSPVGSSAWTDELGAKLTWMAGQGIESASLRLSPEHLGPLQVSISVHDGQASVWFGAAQPDTRAALQQSLPQLRQLFANQGLTLADAGVSREPPRGQTRRQPARTATATTSVAAVTLEGAAGPGSIAGGFGLLDTYV
ncbi:MAG: flagellar hook-length control protein FliK [Steroidobacteraceae bacterium]